MQERSLKLYNSEKTFFVKISTKLTQLLMPTKFGISNMLITIKRNNVLKAYNNYKEILEQNDVENEEEACQKYEDTYALYLESIDKYIMESLYKKIKSNLAEQYEKDALSNYYTIVSLKDKNYIEYKHRKQKYLIELDYKGIEEQRKTNLLNKFTPFYIEKMDSLYKGIIKNYSVLLVDNIKKLDNKDEIYDNIFDTIEEYVTTILPLKMQKPEFKNNIELAQEYDRYQRFLAGKLDGIDGIEKNAVLIDISRLVFTHSLPLATAEKCYIKLLKDARALLVKYYGKDKFNSIYNLFINIIEEYNKKLLVTKIYWDKPEQRDEYKEFLNKYKEISKIKDETERNNKKEILFLKQDLKALCRSKSNYDDVIKLFKDKLVEYNAIRAIKNNAKTIQNCKYIGKTKLTKKDPIGA